MKMLLSIMPDQIRITREKWGVIAFALFGDILCITVAAIFYIVSSSNSSQAHEIAPLLISVVFAGLGIAHLLFMFPKQVATLLAQDGLHILIADKAGLTITKAIGMKPQFFEWDKILRIVLAQRLETIESDETSHSWNELTLFFKPGSLVFKNFIGRANAGISKHHACEYTSINFPKGCADELALALKGYAPHGVAIQSFDKAVFNLKTDGAITEKL